ncbi:MULTISPECIES: hypothetical protein [unclassified Leptolyngbya]|uniref:hypothetical protein n=1 Tax=unclassified Leptolyngbya TaxID=2650499 RepID=UPI00168483A7|nr:MULTISPECIES: hypothetical protein [unclassified Leptolyngbya]MBD1910103.1 hypothetical protein [Leptolyngbya sp. FACHB-8]MBD2156875.1 hypothetical protein [Leptolyngbya sp. FACHB-16]
MPKPKQLALLLALIAGSAVYTYSYHTLDANFLWKSLVVLLPVQVGASIYLAYLYWSGKIAGTQPQIKKADDQEPRIKIDP